MTVFVTSSDGRYDATRVDPHVAIYEGLELRTRFGMGMVYDPVDGIFKPKPGQVTPILRVYDCWDYIDGPADVL